MKSNIGILVWRLPKFPYYHEVCSGKQESRKEKVAFRSGTSAETNWIICGPIGQSANGNFHRESNVPVENGQAALFCRGPGQDWLTNTPRRTFRSG